MKTKDSHSMQLHFKVESPANFVKMCCTIHFEKKEELSDYITVWHDAFDGASGDQLFEQFLEELFSGGCVIGEKELNQITDRAVQFLKTDPSCLDLKAAHDKARFKYWVYFIPEHKVYECDFAHHEDTIIHILADFFGNSIETYDSHTIKQFILNSFELKSYNSTVRTIAEDVTYIQYTAAHFAAEKKINRRTEP